MLVHTEERNEQKCDVNSLHQDRGAHKGAEEGSNSGQDPMNEVNAGPDDEGKEESGPLTPDAVDEAAVDDDGEQSRGDGENHSLTRLTGGINQLVPGLREEGGDRQGAQDDVDNGDQHRAKPETAAVATVFSWCLHHGKEEL